MKLIKNKTIETVTEEITVGDGIYYFSLGYFGGEPYEYYKIEIETSGNSDVYPEVGFTKVRDSYEDYLVLFRKDYRDSLPTIAELYFKGENLNDEESIKTITEEEFLAVKEKVKQLL